jgi:hypothetical protein
VDAEYRDWHAGVELDRTTGRWLGFIEDAEGCDRRFVPMRFSDEAGAKLAAKALLAQPHKYALVGTEAHRA